MRKKSKHPLEGSKSCAKSKNHDELHAELLRSAAMGHECLRLALLTAAPGYKGRCTPNPLLISSFQKLIESNRYCEKVS